MGFRHNFMPGSDLIGNFMYQNQSFREKDSLILLDPTLLYIGDKYNANALSGELQYIHTWKKLKTIMGAGYFGVNWKDNNVWVVDFPPPTALPGVVKGDIDHTNVYFYSYINFPEKVTWTIGGSGDFFEGGSLDKNQFNPKLGMTWNIFPDTTLRAAAFKVFKRTLLTNQTIEPTQVAGFNQFFDDWNETKSWRYGVALDQKFSRNLYGGLEYSWRDLKFPYTDFSSGVPVVEEEKWHEDIGRAYLYWTPHNWFALTAEYLYERNKRDEDFALGVKRLETHRVPLGASFYHPSGFSAMVKGTYVNQRGDIERQFTPSSERWIHDSDQFWLFDAAISYRLPKRFGFITVGAKNFFNQSFKYYDTDPWGPRLFSQTEWSTARLLWHFNKGTENTIKEGVSTYTYCFNIKLKGGSNNEENDHSFVCSYRNSYVDPGYQGRGGLP